MLAAIRLKGCIGKRKKIEYTLKMLGLKKINTLSILPKNDSIIGMLKKSENMITWGEFEGDTEKKIVHLKPPKKGFKSIKKYYPKGDIGYRGKEINNLISRMS